MFHNVNIKVAGDTHLCVSFVYRPYKVPTSVLIFQGCCIDWEDYHLVGSVYTADISTVDDVDLWHQRGYALSGLHWVSFGTIVRNEYSRKSVGQYTTVAIVLLCWYSYCLYERTERSESCVICTTAGTKLPNPLLNKRPSECVGTALIDNDEPVLSNSTSKSGPCQMCKAGRATCIMRICAAVFKMLE